MAQKKFHNMYGRAWRKVRESFLREHPFCARCGKPLSGADGIVDHIVPHKGSWALFWDKNNWQALCKSCHDSYKQALEHGTIRSGCDVSGMPLDDNHPWNKKE